MTTLLSPTGYLYTGFTPEACSHYCLLAPAFECSAITISWIPCSRIAIVAVQVVISQATGEFFSEAPRV